MDPITLANVNIPHLVAIEAVGSVSAGLYHTAAIMREGRLFTWRNNGHGQLRHGHTIPFQRLWHRSLI